MYKIVFLILLLDVCVGCQENRRIGRQLSRIEQIMATAPDSSLRLLKQMDVSGFPSERLQAKYSLLLSEALEKNDVYLTGDTVIKAAVDYYSRRGGRTERAKTFYYLGRIHENARDFEAAIKAYIRAGEFSEKEDHRLRGLIFNSIGNLYAEQLSYQEALMMYSQAQCQTYMKNGISMNGTIYFSLPKKKLIRYIKDRC